MQLGRGTRAAVSPQTRAAAVALSALFALLGVGCRDADDSPRPAQDSLVELRKLFGIDVVSCEKAFESRGQLGIVTGSPPERVDLQRYLPLFAREFSLYPNDLVKRAGLKRIVLCARLRCSEGDFAGLAEYDPPTMYLDVSLPEEEAHYQCLALHHEFFHLIDCADDGVIGQDEQWPDYNPHGFRYTEHYGARESAGSGPAGALRGFLTVTSLTNIAEDKAEVFAHLIVNGSSVAERAECDPYVGAKVIAIKRTLAEFSPAIGERFWDAAQRVERPSANAEISASYLLEGAPSDLISLPSVTPEQSFQLWEELHWPLSD
jgi:hypothetical protein